MSSPLLITLRLDAQAHGFFNGLRQLHFPPARNFLEAHLTLFHHLPGDEEAAVAATLGDVCTRQIPLTLDVSGLMFLGCGVAYRLESEPLQALHATLQILWQEWLTPQDRQRLRPHVTVQNKVSAATARQLLAELQPSFSPWQAAGDALQLWRYQGGPWEWVADFELGEPA